MSGRCVPAFWRQITKSIIFDTEFICFDTKSIISNAKFIIFDTKFIFLIPKFIISNAKFVTFIRAWKIRLGATRTTLPHTAIRSLQSTANCNINTNFILGFSVENAEEMENCPWKSMIFYWKTRIFYWQTALDFCLQFEVPRAVRPTRTDCWLRWSV